MTYKEETFLLKKVSRVSKRIDILEAKIDVLDRKLNRINGYIDYLISNHNQENDNDFGRNVLANLISNVFDNKV